MDEAAVSSWADMTEHEQNAALAELLGWTCREEETYWPNKEMVWRDTAGVKRKDLCFTTSLDAMRLVEDALSGWLWDKYISELVHILDIYGEKSYYDWDRKWGDAVWSVLRSTPAQRAEAAWRVLTKGALPS